MAFKFPGASDRVSIFGATGSGKTRFGVWLFSHSSFSKRPYIVVDFKGDDLIAGIERAREIRLGEVPKHPGLYVLRPTPAQGEEVNAYLWKIWEKGNTGLFFDEGYMVNKSPALDAILTQGRSLKIPTMILTQRPAWCSRFIFSEANFYAMFRLNDKRDMDTVRGFTPANNVFDFSNRLPEYTARWYDVGRDWSSFIEPVPGDDYILDRYDSALKVRHKGL
jgi:DNA helicase HerA-like ATPase